MPNWKKLIVSGSDANLNSLTVTTTGSFYDDLTISGSNSSLILKGDGTKFARLTHNGNGLVIDGGVQNQYISIGSPTWNWPNGVKIYGDLQQTGSAGSTATFEGPTQSTVNLKTTSGSKNNYIVGTTTGDISFRPDGVASVLFKSGGNVGINVTNPARKLVVNGQTQFSDYSGATLTNQAHSNYLFDSLINHSSSTSGGGIGAYVKLAAAATNATGTYNAIRTRAYAENTTTNTEELINFFAEYRNYTSTSSVTLEKSTGLKVGQLGIGGSATVTNNYGIYLDPGTNATNNYGIYQVGASVDNYLQGNVGIGITNPNEKLEVSGNIKTTGALKLFNSTNHYGTVDADSEGLTLDTVANRHLRFLQNGNEAMRIDTSSNVGIGTSSPTKKLEVLGGLVINSGFNTGVSSLYLSHTNNSAQHKAGIFTTYTTGYGRSSSMQFALNSEMNSTVVTTADAKMTILEGGKVGIGTAAPSAELHVYKEGNSFIKIDSGATSPYMAGVEFLRSSINGGRIYNDGGAVQVKLESYYGYESANPTRGGFTFKTAPVTSGTLVDALRINALGDIGIGTSSPGYKLDLDLNTSSDRLNITRGGAQKAYITGDGAGVFYANLVSYGNSLSGGGGMFQYGGGYGTQAVAHRFKHLTGTFTGTSGNQTMVEILPSVSQSATAGYTGLKVNVSETSIGSGTNNLLDLQVGGVSKYAVDRDGDVTIGGDVTVAGTLTAQEFHTEFVSASIVYESGSTKFGNTVDDNHDFTGSLNILAQSGASGIQLDRGSNTYININNSSTRNEFNFKSSAGLRFYHGTDSTSPLFISSSGNVGIGTTSPLSRLTVAGGTGTTYNDGTLQVVGTIAMVSTSNLNAALNRWVLRPRAAGVDGSFDIYDARHSLTRLAINNAGKVTLPAYGSGTFTGTLTSTLGVDSSGNIIEFTGGGGGSVSAITSGADTRVAYFNGTDSLEGSANFTWDDTQLTVVGDVEADEFIGDLRGAVLFKAQAGEALSKGDAVYISGISGNTTVVSKADADDVNKMPAFGIASAAASLNNPVDIYTVGTLKGIDTSGFTIGDELYVSSSAGELTATSPTGESTLIQKIAKVTRVDNAAGSIKISGAGRTNATPNLNEGRLFVGNASNQAVADGTIHVDIANSRVGIGTALPGAKLDVHGRVDFANDFRLRGTDAAADQGVVRFYVNSNNVLTIDTANNGNDLFVIDEGGQVGIGTTSPDSLLELYSSTTTDFLKLTSGGSSASPIKLIFEKGSTEQGIIEYNRNGDLELYNTDGDGGVMINGRNSADGDLYVNNSGNVGIGTTTPATKLDVAGTTPVIRLTDTRNLNVGDWDDVSLGKIQFHTSDTTSPGARTLAEIEAYSSVDAASGPEAELRFKTSTITDSSAQTRMIIDAGGKVGIGTSDPTSKLQVYGNSTYISSKNTSNHKVVEIGADSSGDGLIILRDSSNNNKIKLYAENNADNYINNGGNVGIGTASPSFNLHVNSASNGVTAIGVGNTGTGASRVYLDASNGDFAGSDYMWIGQNNDLSGEIFMPQSAGSFHIKTQPGGTSTTQFTVNQAGNVGIGSSSPAYKLDVAGDIQNNGVLRRGGNVYIKSTGSDTSIGPAGAGTITFHTSSVLTGAAEAMRIDADGNLLLNNTSANARLDIREDTNYAIRAEDASGHYFRVNTGGDVDMRGDLVVQGTITAQQFHSEFVSASIIYDSGSTKFGDTSDDTHNFTGSLTVNNAAGTSNLFRAERSSTYYYNIGQYANVDHRVNGSVVAQTIRNTTTSQTAPLLSLGHSNSGAHITTYGTNEDLIIDPNGTGKLDVLGTIRGTGTTSRLILDNTQGQSFQIYAWSSGTNVYNNSSTNPNVYFGRDAGTANNFYFTRNGTDFTMKVDTANERVGIGTTSPAGKLHVYGGRSYFAPQGGSSSGVNSHAAVFYNPHDTAFTANALAAYNAHTSWDIESRSTFTISPRTKDTSIYTYAGEHATSTAALNRFVQFNSNNTNALHQWNFYQYDGTGTASTDLKKPSTLWRVSSYDVGVSTQKLLLSGDGDLTITGDLDSADVTIDDWGSVSASLASISDAGGVNGSGTATYLTKWVDSDTVTSSGMFQAASGNFSIGISTPNAKLSVVNDISIGTSATDVLRLHNESGVGTIDGYSTRSIAFGSATNGEVMRIDNTNGRVGIGTTTPSYKLTSYSTTAEGSATDEFPIVAGKANAIGNFTGIGLSGYIAGNGAVKAGIVLDRVGSYGTGNLHILNNNTTTNADATLSDSKVTILGNGNVGIGTTAPKQLFHVHGGSTAGSVTKAVIGGTGGNGESYLYLAEHFSGDNVNYGFSFVTDGNSSNNLLIKRHSNSTSGVTVLTINRDNSDASFSGALQVGSNLDVNGTSLTLSSAAITYQNNNDVDTGTETIATVVKANHDAAFFDYVVKNGTNLRAGTVIAVHDGTNVEFTDNSTKDIGDTSGVTFSVDISGTDLRLRATTTSDNWVIKTLVKSI